MNTSFVRFPEVLGIIGQEGLLISWLEYRALFLYIDVCCARSLSRVHSIQLLK